MKRMFYVVGAYVAHLFVGFLMFVALLLFGAALHKLEHWSRPIVDDPNFKAAMSWVGTAILWSDAFFLIWWTVYSTAIAIRELYHARVH